MNNTLLKGLAIVELLAHSREPMTLTEIARALSLTKSNVHRLLDALLTNNYVIKDANSGAYSASIRLWELGSAVLAKLDLRRHAAHLMDSLADQTGESVHLSVRDGNEVVYVHKVDSPNPVRAYSQIGGRSPIYCVATGKAMLVQQGKEGLGRIMRDAQAHTSTTIVSVDAMAAELDITRKRGYAVNSGEWHAGIYGVAVPIYDGTGHVIAAIGLSGPKERFIKNCIDDFAEKLKHSAQEIMANLGSKPMLWSASPFQGL